MAELKFETDAPPKEHEKLADEEIKKFDDWFQKQTGNEPLVRSERAILKTYLYYKLRGPHGA